MRESKIVEQGSGMSRTTGISLREEIAYHEAGHAVLALQSGSPVERISIVPQEGSLGQVDNHWWELAEIPHDIVDVRCPKCGTFVTGLLTDCVRDDAL
jgi:hypothetical protein